MTQERIAEASARMSEHEALMWNIEKDPWLNPSGASVVLLDRPLDMDRFRQTLRAGVYPAEQIVKLRQELEVVSRRSL